MNRGFFHKYGRIYHISGDLDAAERLAHKALLVDQGRIYANVNNLDQTRVFKEYQDGSTICCVDTFGTTRIDIHVPPSGGVVKKYRRSKKIEIIPYLFATENSFDRGGVLVCRGGLDFSGPYELLSPYGDVSSFSTHTYQPYSYVYYDGAYEIIVRWYDHNNYEGDKEPTVIEFQIKKYYDPERLIENEETGESNPVLWDEVPWMSGRGWEPVYWETYEEFMAYDGPYDYGKPDYIKYTRTEYEVDVGTSTLYATSAPFHDFLKYGSYTAHYETMEDRVTGEYRLAGNVIWETFSLHNREQIVTKGMTDTTYTTWWGMWEDIGEPSPPPTDTWGLYDDDTPFKNEWASWCSIYRGGESECYDQNDLTKYATVYKLTEGSYFHRSSWHNLSDIEGREGYPDTNYTETVTAQFKGLGHQAQLFEVDGGFSTATKLYKIGDTYTCLFSATDGTRKVVGSAVEGGELTVVDVSEGILFEGENRTIMTSTYNNLGMIIREEPEKVEEI